ncbi:MAG: GNAT family N-acetyltransferase [Phototrophicaceae bacterium]
MTVIYETPRTLVRAFEANDVDDCFVWMSDPEVARYELYPPYDYEETREDVLRAGALPINTPGVWNEYAVVTRDTRRVIGGVSFHYDDSENRSFEVGYRIATGHQRQGYAREAVHGLLQLVFSLGAHRVFAIMDVRNTASVRLAERLGMRREAHMLQNVWVKGEWNDEYIYAMLEHEFQP